MRFLYAAITAITWMIFTANVESISLEIRWLMLAIVVAGALAGGD